jgi:F-type H+-transporting ATPase subunit c
MIKEDMMEAMTGSEIVRAVAVASAGFCMAIGSIGPSLGEGMTAAKACEGVSREPQNAGIITRTMLVALAVIESLGIYCFVIALLLIFIVK